jgi:hypothetical protein
MPVAAAVNEVAPRVEEDATYTSVPLCPTSRVSSEASGATEIPAPESDGRRWLAAVPPVFAMVTLTSNCRESATCAGGATVTASVAGGAAEARKAAGSTACPVGPSRTRSSGSPDSPAGTVAARVWLSTQRMPVSGTSPRVAWNDASRSVPRARCRSPSRLK